MPHAVFTMPAPVPPPRPYPPDAEAQDLIRRAECRATGADIHRVANLCATYRLFTGLATKHDPQGDQAAQRERVEATLRNYVSTGRLPRANSELLN